LTSETAEVTISAAPPTTASQSTGRHRGEGGRPSGNSSRVRKNRYPVIPSSTVKPQPAQAAPGSLSAAGRAA
jgi:hypothetical protein